MTYQDTVFQSLASKGFTGSINDKLTSFFKSNGATGNTLNELGMNFLSSKGFSQPNYNDRWVAYLRANNLPLNFNYPVIENLAQEVKAQLLRLGHSLLIPGVGEIDGFPAGNYLESQGPTPTSVSGLVGLALDAGRAADTPQTLSAWSGTGMTLSVVSGWQRGTSTTTPAFISVSFPSVIGETYRVSGLLRASAGQWNYRIGTAAGGNQIYVGGIGANLDIFVVATSTTTHISVRSGTITVGDYVEVKDVQATRISGIHFRQATTANKPQLLQAGVIYRWVFDGTDVLSASIPSGLGYADCTIIDAAPGGQVTLTGQNLSGTTYSIGPGVTTHGRIIAPNGSSMTAAELVLYQRYMNNLAGVA